MSSKALSTVLFPEPERPVRMTSWRASRLTGCFTGRDRSVLHPPLVSAGYAHILAIFRHRAASDVNAGVVEFLGYLVVGERLGAVFFFDHFLDQALEREQRHAAAFRTVHGFTEEGAQFQDALRGVRVLAGHGATDRGRMHADFFGDLLDHHRLQSVGAVVEKFTLARDYGLADAQDGVFALLDVFHQLDGGGESFFHVIADIAVGCITHQQAAIGGTETELRHVVLVQERLPLIVHFAEIDVRLDQAGLGFVVAQSRARIELFDYIESAFYDFQRTVQSAGDFFQLVGLDLLEMFRNDLLRQSVLRIECFQLPKQALAQILRPDTDRIKVLYNGQRIIQIILRILAALHQLFDRSREITVFVKIADDAFGQLAHRVGANRHAQLPGQVIAEAGSRGKKLLERRTLGNFALLRAATVPAGIEILIEEGADVEFVKGIRFRLLRDFFGFCLQEGFVAVVVGLRGLFALFFQDRVGNHLLVDHLAQLKAIEREHADHLNEARSQNLLLRNLQIQFEPLPRHNFSCLFLV